ncbi:MAG: hypothetical protein L3J28_12260 [Candidatus Polarisedimenticolaceae bacterium]|nr:hypothetical protein [Candidatus Polarisedimenticolaceae bacterium]
MFTKLIFTLSIVGLGYLYWLRSHKRPMAPKVDCSAVDRAGEVKANSNIRLASYLLILFMVLATGSFLYLEWRDQYRVVEVSVINTNTGDRVAYRARRGDVDGRVFETIDGVVVRLADIERLELGSADKRH